MATWLWECQTETSVVVGSQVFSCVCFGEKVIQPHNLTWQNVVCFDESFAYSWYSLNQIHEVVNVETTSVTSLCLYWCTWCIVIAIQSVLRFIQQA